MKFNARYKVTAPIKERIKNIEPNEQTNRDHILGNEESNHHEIALMECIV